MFKKRKRFSLILVVTEVYRFKIVHFLPIFGLWNRDHVTGRPQTWCAYILFCTQVAFQRSTFSKFIAIGELINFLNKNGSFFSNLKFLNHDHVT